MGTLTPGATYIYERADGIIYAREAGADPSKRFIVGYESPDDYKRITDSGNDELWRKIRRAAKTNPSLQEALDQVKVIYELSKSNE